MTSGGSAGAMFWQTVIGTNAGSGAGKLVDGDVGATVLSGRRHLFLAAGFLPSHKAVLTVRRQAAIKFLPLTFESGA
jgi:hypothetical protein